MLAPTPHDRLVDPQGRPYFLWDMEMTLSEFERILADHDADARPYLRVRSSLKSCVRCSNGPRSDLDINALASSAGLAFHTADLDRFRHELISTLTRP